MQAGTRFNNPGGMEGWVDLVDLTALQPGVELVTFWSPVRCRTAAPPRQRTAWTVTKRYNLHKNCVNKWIRSLPQEDNFATTRIYWHVLSECQHMRCNGQMKNLAVRVNRDLPVRKASESWCHRPRCELDSKLHKHQTHRTPMSGGTVSQCGRNSENLCAFNNNKKFND